jgi:hypothetical protein
MDGFHITFDRLVIPVILDGLESWLEVDGNVQIQKKKSPELKAGEPLSYHLMPLNLFESRKVMIFHIYVGLRKVCTRVFPCLLRFLPQFLWVANFSGWWSH